MAVVFVRICGGLYGVTGCVVMLLQFDSYPEYEVRKSTNCGLPRFFVEGVCLGSCFGLLFVLYYEFVVDGPSRVCGGVLWLTLLSVNAWFIVIVGLRYGCSCLTARARFLYFCV